MNENLTFDWRGDDNHPEPYVRISLAKLPDSGYRLLFSVIDNPYASRRIAIEFAHPNSLENLAQCGKEGEVLLKEMAI